MPVIKEADTAAWKLFKIYYRVGIPEMFFHDPEWVAKYGRPTSGNKMVDRSMMNTERTVMLPVSDIVRYFELGANISFKNINDIIIVYRDIVEHLGDWENAIRNNIHGNMEAPTEDLVLFDQFKDALYHLTIRAEDPLVKHSDISTVRRTFGRRRSKFNGEFHQEEIPDTYSPDGSHIYNAGLGAEAFEPKEFKNQQEEATFLEDVQRKTNPKHVKSYTAIFEKYHAEQVAKGNIK